MERDSTPYKTNLDFMRVYGILFHRIPRGKITTCNLRLTNCKAQVGGAQKGEQAMISPSKTKGEINMTFADNLVRLRREKGFSQEQLADLMDVSRQAVSKWEAGQPHI